VIRALKKNVCKLVGGVASPVLANLALDGLERERRRHFPRPKRGDNATVQMVR
jgi:hypothetical protein